MKCKMCNNETETKKPQNLRKIPKYSQHTPPARSNHHTKIKFRIFQTCIFITRSFQMIKECNGRE